ncbi:MAG TPA: alkaline phosphatase PhoX, partial [Burkholderiaceae bacterium]|nr:alkaline phosphatase PhoX [Burkholderiaceae bacterium]
MNKPADLPLHSLDLDDIGHNTSRNREFTDVLQARLSRRGLLRGAVGTAATAVFGSIGLAACGGGDDDEETPAPLTALGFSAVAKSLADVLTMPSGYAATVLYRLGDPIASIADYKNDGTETGDSFTQRAGDHHDGISFFGMSNGAWDASTSSAGLLAMNHENITSAYLHANGQTISGSGATAVRTVADEVVKEINAHGVSVVEVQRGTGGWSINKISSFNRRITAASEMAMSGPVAKSKYLITKFSTDGSKTRGTVNNCANGRTPWGTYLTCEENWNGYFRRIAAIDNANRSANELVALARYGVAGNGNNFWGTVTPDTADNQYGRWVAMKTGSSTDGSDDYRNVANTYGW